MSNPFENPATAERRKRRPYRIAIVLAIVVFILAAPEIQNGHSMDPTIQDGQVLVVSKTRYSAKRKAPESDKLVILEKAYSLDAGAEDNIITRVIAVPGDRIKAEKGKIFVNDEEYETKDGITGTTKNFKERKLEGNEVYVLCDNRNRNSEKYDSRNPNLGKGGLIDMREIKGNVLLRVWPLGSIAVMTGK